MWGTQGLLLKLVAMYLAWARLLETGFLQIAVYVGGLIPVRVTVHMICSSSNCVYLLLFLYLINN